MRSAVDVLPKIPKISDLTGSDVFKLDFVSD